MFRTSPAAYPPLRLQADDECVAVSVVVPALNEAENLPLLLPRIAGALAGVDHEVIVVDDDSHDDTRAVCARLACAYPLRLIVRTAPRDGLSGAVLEGMAAARGDAVVVMDADLQHPPERIPDLLNALAGGADFAIGSRYAPGGTTGERWGVLRRINSRVATLLARPFAGAVRDPMSGFFALSRDALDRADRLTPLGYKIGLELMTKCRAADVREVPIHFDCRTRGASKLTVGQQFKYLEHLSRLYDHAFPRASPACKFAVVAGLAGGIAAGVFAGLLPLSTAAWWPAVAVALAYPFAAGATAVFHARYVRAQRAYLETRTPWRDFAASSLAEWAASAAAACWAAARLSDPRAAELFATGLAAALVARYVLRKELKLDVRGLRGAAQGRPGQRDVASPRPVRQAA